MGARIGPARVVPLVSYLAVGCHLPSPADRGGHASGGLRIRRVRTCCDISKESHS